MKRIGFGMLTAIVSCVMGFSPGSVLAATVILKQPAGIKVVPSSQPLSKALLMTLNRRTILPIIRKNVIQKVTILSNSGLGGTGTGTSAGGAGTPASMSAVVNSTTTMVTNSFGSDDQVFLTATNPQLFTSSQCLFGADPNLGLTSTNFDDNGPMMVVSVIANEVSPSAMFMVDFTVQLSSPVNTNYLVQTANIFTQTTTSMVTTANSGANYGSGQTQDIVVLVQGNDAFAAIQCPTYWNFVSAEVTPVQ
jgi:hypothetical protein